MTLNAKREEQRQERGIASGEDRSKDLRGPDHILDLTELCICVCVCVCVCVHLYLCVLNMKFHNGSPFLIWKTLFCTPDSLTGAGL